TAVVTNSPANTGYIVETPADLNGDGKIDVAAGLYSTATRSNGYSNVVSLINDGTGKFTASKQFAITGQGPIAVGDLNGDGKVDMVALDQAANVARVAQGNGAGAFTLTGEL